MTITTRVKKVTILLCSGPGFDSPGCQVNYLFLTLIPHPTDILQQSSSFSCFSMLFPDAANTSACLHDNGGCDQVCRGVGGRPVCTCLSGYDLLKDGRTCSGDSCIPIRDFLDHATFREKGAKLACADKLGVFLSLTLCNPIMSQI